MKCPHCNEETDWLRNYTKVEKIYSFDGFNYVELDEIFLDNVDDFECPNCDTSLTHDEKEAIRLLKGE